MEVRRSHKHVIVNSPTRGTVRCVRVWGGCICPIGNYSVLYHCESGDHFTDLTHTHCLRLPVFRNGFAKPLIGLSLCDVNLLTFPFSRSFSLRPLIDSTAQFFLVMSLVTLSSVCIF